MGEIERGEVTVTIVTALKLAKAFGMTLAALFGELEVHDTGTGRQGGGEL